MTQDRVLVIQTAFLGDAILTLPLLQIIAEKHPGAIIDVLCIESSKSIFKLSPFVSNVIVFDKRGEHKSIKNVISLALQLNKNGYSKIISPHRSLRTSILVMFLQATEKIGFKNSALSFVYNKRVEYRYDKHEIDRNILLVDSEAKGEVFPTFNYDEAEIARVGSEVKDLTKGNKYIVIAPGSQWETKRYPIESFGEVANAFVSNGYKVLVIGSKNEVNLCGRICDNKNILNIAGKYDISLIPLIMKGADLVVTNDSSPTHLALVARAKCLTIYCSTVPAFGFGAYGDESKHIEVEDLWCKPCGIHGYKKCLSGKFECGYLLKSEMVFSAGKEFING